jgi:Uma2 family endonuclease
VWYNEPELDLLPDGLRGQQSMSVASAASSTESTAIGIKTEPSPAPLIVPEDMLYEVVDGQIEEKIVGAQESEIASLLIEFLAPFIRSHRLGKVSGETLFWINKSKDLQRRPDVAFVSAARWPFNRRAPDTAVWDVVPDLAIEVVSPTNSAVAVQAKIHDYFEVGVRRVWVIYPKQMSIHIYTSTTQIQGLQLGDELDGGDLIPGFRLPLAALFEDDPE